jgi:uncharacterized surface protein with fasciclin (FAS1) repeats
MPSLTGDLGLAGDFEDYVDYIADDVDTVEEVRFSPEGHWEDVVWTEELVYDVDINVDDDAEMTTLVEPPEGSIFGAALDPSKLPKIPLPEIPSKLPKIDLPGGGDRDHPHPPNHEHSRPPHPHPPQRPGNPGKRPGFHWPGHRKGPNPQFQYINHTIFEFLANSTHHKHLYKLVKNDSSLIDLFNTTGKDGKITLFAPTDQAFEKIIKHIPKNHTHPPKWLLKKLIEYHTIDSFYPASRVLAHRTIPTLFKAHHGPNLTQHIRIGAGLKGVNINFYAHPVFLDIFTANGVIHAIDSILLPPPPAYFILNIFPTVFSTFFQAFHQTGVVNDFFPFAHAFHKFGVMNDFFPWLKNGSSWTIFAPTNIAWVKIPLKVTAWLFSPRGHHILTKLVQYHISPNTTFYTDSIWKFPHPPKDINDSLAENSLPHRPYWKKQHFNTSLPTLASKNATLRIDEIKFGPFVKIAINGRPGGIIANDVLAFDGVIQAVDRIVLPPRKRCHHRHGKHGNENEEDVVEEEWISGPAEDDEWTIENLERIFAE